MVRPSAASLNLLAKVLRQAQPLYTECRSILNYLDHSNGVVFLSPRPDTAFGPVCVSASNDANNQPQNILEPRVLDQKSIM